MKLANLIALLCTAVCAANAQPAHQATTYYVDCSIAATSSTPTSGVLLRSLAAVNHIQLTPGDSLLFKRGTTCNGTLHPRGSGSAAAPIHLAAYGEGSLPQIKATTTDDDAFRLFNQQYWDISALDITGSRLTGIFVGGELSDLHHIYLHDLRVHDIRGEMTRKESGLIVINPDHKTSHIDDLLLDGIQAYATTQWSGIFISHVSHVRVLNSIVHDVQGDGIAIFTSADALVAHSAAWHTGMQHWQTIGTPNGIWTWRCTDCIVEDNEAFLTDSPGVDGGAFDIDFGNTRNTIRRNFAHDTGGYCAAVFGSLGLTLDSVVADNLCLSNGLSPHLAQRQGALLIQTWQNGMITNVDIHGNRIDWQPPGITPAIQVGVSLVASGIRIHDNEIHSTGPVFIDPQLPYTGEGNRFIAADAFHPAFDMRPTRTSGWHLEASLPAAASADGNSDRVRALFVALKSAALQFNHAGLQVLLLTDARTLDLAADWHLAEDGVIFVTAADVTGFSLALISPQQTPAKVWHDNPGAVDLGLALRQTVGPPLYGYLEMDRVEAH